MTKNYQVSIVKASFWIPIGYPDDVSKAEELLAKGEVMV
jgi:NDP-sugar pyrophosphorylase family protein